MTRTINKQKEREYLAKKYWANPSDFGDDFIDKWRKDKNEKTLEYYYKNKDKILEKRKVKVKCECGKEVKYGCLGNHRKSKKHISIMENKHENK